MGRLCFGPEVASLLSTVELVYGGKYIKQGNSVFVRLLHQHNWVGFHWFNWFLIAKTNEFGSIDFQCIYDSLS